jgi:hypothetical protein
MGRFYKLKFILNEMGGFNLIAIDQFVKIETSKKG